MELAVARMMAAALSPDFIDDGHDADGESTARQVFIFYQQCPGPPLLIKYSYNNLNMLIRIAIAAVQ